MNTDKHTAVVAAKSFKAIGGEIIIVSPGSRNAPLVQSFTSERLELISIVDERSAAFIALGIAIQKNKPVGLCCTSGSALLNYAPALAEAYYLNVPLIVFSADRPEHLIDQGVGQTIQQQNVFSNFQKSFLQLPLQITVDKAPDLYNKIQATMSESISGNKGPVHLNIPFDEPLYNQSESSNFLSSAQKINIEKPNFQFPAALAYAVRSDRRIMIITAVLSKNNELNQLINEFSNFENVIILKEHTSNLNDERAISTIDRVLELVDESHRPDIVVTLGEQIISKRIKAFVAQSDCKHWHISEGGIERNTFGKLRGVARGKAEEVLQILHENILKKVNSDYREKWLRVDALAQERHVAFTVDIPYSDFFVFKKIQETLPFNYHLQSANSSVVRYFQLFKDLKTKYFHANRGTSGIDGSTSTAVGYCYAANEPTLLVTGDLSFMYDSNGLWNNIKSPLLRIIVINNSGGGIFRIIPGPQSVKGFEEYFEAQHQTSFEGICNTMGVDYQCASNEKELDNALDSFFEISTVTKVLEVKTPNTENDKVLKSYFKYIKTGNREEVD